ncbi:hypothetical protein HG430_004430 [Candidatus Gracilibacteria bacterium]|nr:hypothetical protein [Candidatus Gracilibacteria bacterium]
MKFFCKITLIIFFIFSIINTVKAENEIDKLELIERYIVNYKKNISLVVAKYEIKDNKDIKDTTDSLNFLLEIISKVKDSNMSEQEKERVVKFLTKNLKEINGKSKETLKKGKEDFDKKVKQIQESYSKLGLKISGQLDFFIQKIHKLKLNKEILNSKESILKENLNRIVEISRELKDFGEINFNSEKEIKTYFKNIIQDIRRELLKLKENIK